MYSDTLRRPLQRTAFTRYRALAVALVTLATGSLSAPSARASSPSLARPYRAISDGYQHSCALGRDGKVYCGGSNVYGQLGDGTTTARHVPVVLPGLANQVAVAAGSWHSCAVGADGTVKCWGWNGNGQLGDGGYTSSTSPQPVVVTAFAIWTNPLSSIVEVSASSAHTCARGVNGYVWCWGYNGFGELGDGTTTTRPTAVPVSGITGAIGIAVGAYHSCALLADHTVACWGDNYLGQLGDGTLISRSTPAPVAGLANVKEISATLEGTCALLADGTERCWGDGAAGEIGNGFGGASPPLGKPVIQTLPTPVLTAGGSVFRDIASISQAGSGATNCAVLATGAAYCWGQNANGQTGSGSTGSSNPASCTACQSSPVPVSATTGSFTASISNGFGHACARTTDGNTWCWGDNSQGQLGTNGTTPSSVPVYNDIPQWLSPAQRVTVGSSDACVIGSAGGRPYCWGSNLYGNLGDGTTTARSSPTPVSGLRNVVGLAAIADWDTLALRGDGTVWVWGNGGDAALGNGTTSGSALVPVQAEVSNAVAVGTDCALLVGGSVSCWGVNESGQVGDGTTTTRPLPVLVSGLSNVVVVSGGYDVHYAIGGDGTAWAWGNNYYGALGDGTNVNRSTPVHVQGLSNVVAIDGNTTSACALRADGTAWCWGSGYQGDLGNGAMLGSPVPVQVSSLGDAVTISLGSSPGYPSPCAARVGGSVVCWGSNYYGQLGNGGVDPSSSTPYAVSTLTGAVNVSISPVTALALRADGTLWTWGSAVGTGTVNSSPIQVFFSP